MHLFDKPHMNVSSTELQMFALASWANERVFFYPPFYHFVQIITPCCSTEGKDVLILRPLPRKCSAMEKHFLRRPPSFHRRVLKGVHPLQVLLAALSTFPLCARSQLQNARFISPLSASGGSHICHTVGPAVAKKYLRRPVVLCFFSGRLSCNPKHVHSIN